MQLLVSKSLGACSFFALLEELCQSDSVVFEVLHTKVFDELNHIILELREQEEEHKRLKDELEKLEAAIDVPEIKDIELKPMRCARCNQRLTLPYVAFFYRPNLHDTCCSEEDGHVPCPLCKYGSSPRYSVPAYEQRRPTFWTPLSGLSKLASFRRQLSKHEMLDRLRLVVRGGPIPSFFEASWGE
jgi:hypothetical protein